MSRVRVRRRAFLGTGISAVLAGAGVACRRNPRGSWRFFTDEEAATAAGICGQIIPTDQDPGARDAGVVNYIDLQLSRRFRRYRAIYRQGLAEVDASSRAKFGKPFVSLGANDQVQVLTEIEEKSKVFFDLILNHTRQGFYGDPRHGGNRYMASWKMVGLPFPPVRGRQHYDDSKAG
jgi:gluconate 2-dehydrogenase gamma chain